MLLLATIVTGTKLHVVGHLYGHDGSHGWLVAHVALTVVFTVLTILHIVKLRKWSAAFARSRVWEKVFLENLPICH